VAVDLKRPEAAEVLARLIRALGVDVFCTNTLPARLPALGLDYERLSAIKPDLVWCGISAMGAARPEVPGYDPMLQALCGYMDLTGEAHGPPLQCGPPIIDLKAGDEAFAQVLLGLMERDRTGRGRRIDLSMAQAAVSWLVTFLPMLELGSPPAEVRRSGNRHRQFIPTGVWPARDGLLYVAIGSDAQWARLVARPAFAGLAEARLATNEGRRAAEDELRAALAALSSARTIGELVAELAAAEIPHAPITPIEDVARLPFVAEARLRTTTPDGRELSLPPPAVATPWLEERGGHVGFAPSYGEHTDAVLAEVGYTRSEIADLRGDGVVA
jgi:crotonobetainyl-CoA:carnitine CoA-transferase CaiB-like acyl-CoA transferase